MILREMLVDDLDQVMEIEQDLFHVPWTKEGFFTFLTRDDAMFLVVEEKEKILGYCGLLMVLDEGDITNVAVRRDRQKEGIGAFLMQSLIRLAAESLLMVHRDGLQQRGRLRQSIWKYVWEMRLQSVSMNVWDLPEMEYVRHITVILWRMRCL